MRSARRAALTLVVAGAACGPGAHRDERIAALLADYDGADRPGACLLTRRDGAVIYERCFGMAELESGQPTTPATSFRLASVTKQFTATAVLLLVQDGRLDTLATLRELFPDFPAWADAVTIQHLLTHTAGLVDYEDVMPPGDTTQILDAGVLDLLRTQDSTYFPPGSAFRYSNSAYAVLAMVVERVSGQRFGLYLAERVFAPLGMDRTVAHEDGVTSVAQRAYGHSRQPDGSWLRTDQSTTSAVLGDGGIYTSLRDFNRWLDVVEGRRRLLDTALAARMFTEATLTNGRGAGYGYGWYVGSEGGRRRYHHEGSTIGFRNAVRRYPDEDLTVVFLSNRNEIAEGLVDALVAAFR
jgi:CubicO group peptidase (beta-lactamase class C family)